MTNDEAGNRVMGFLAEQITLMVKQARSVLRDGVVVPELQPSIIGTLLDNIVRELSSGELGRAMEHLIDNQKSIPESSPNGNIKGWVNDIIDRAGGLKSFHKYELGGTRANTYDAASWVIRCLANPRCAGSGDVVKAILDERARKLGLPDDLEARLNAGLLKDQP